MSKKGLNSLVGLATEKRKCLINIKACRVTGEPFPSTLLWGIGGTGKTALARAIAEELNYYFVEREAFSLKSPEQIAEMLLGSNREAADRKLLLFVDEVHRLSIRLQEVFYYPMKEWRIMSDGQYAKLKPFTLIAATTRKDMLDEASFVQRFQNIWEISRYHFDHICEIISKIFSDEKMFHGPEEVRAIASRCLGIPRQAANLAIKVRNHALSRNSRTILHCDIEEVFLLEGIDYIGLSELHDRYLAALLPQGSRPKGLVSLAGKLSQHEDVLVGTIEPILLSLGLIDINRGRILTEAGDLHLKKLQKSA